MEKNLNSEEAVEKLQALVKDTSVCMFFTNLQVANHNSRPMTVTDVDRNGNLWFFAKKSSSKVADIEKDNNVHLVFANPSIDSFLDLRGRASIEEDRRSIEEQWHPTLGKWFEKGKEDPEICLIKVKTDEAHYWDTNNTKMRKILKLVSPGSSGKDPKEGVHGELLV